MIKQLNISNFQSHKDSSLNFVDGLNVIIGESDSGKSAILRALRWLIWNRPTGDAMRSNWGGKTSVEIFTDDAHIVRVRDKENEYILGDSHFKAISTDVPQEVVQALNLNEINLQTQLSQPFLLSNSAGEVAQFFNKVAHLEKIDTATQKINSAIRELTNNIKYKNIEIEKQEEELKKYEYLEKFEADVEVLEELDKQYTMLLQKRAKLDDLIIQIENNKADIDELKYLLVLEKQVNMIIEQQLKREEVGVKWRALSNILDHIYDIKIRLEQLNQWIKLEPNVLNLIALVEKRNKIQTELNAFKKDYTEVLMIIKKISAGDIAINLMQQQFEKEMGETCPLCGQPIKYNYGKD